MEVGCETLSLGRSVSQPPFAIAGMGWSIDPGGQMLDSRTFRIATSLKVIIGSGRWSLERLIYIDLIGYNF